MTGLGMAPALAAGPQAQADASAIRGTGPGLGQLFGPVLDGGTCTAKYPGAPTGAPAEKCGDNLTLGGPTSVAYSQEAAANKSAQSGATASVAEGELPGLSESIDLTNIIQGLDDANSSQVLNAVTGLVADLLLQLGQGGLDALYTQLDGIINQALTGLEGAVNLEARIGGVEAQCTATPKIAQGNGTVTGIDIVITLANDQEVIVPIPVGTDPNSELLVSVPELVDEILQGVVATLNESLDGALAPLGDLADEVRTALVNQVLDQLTPLLEQLAAGLEPIIKATINKQVDGDGDEVSHQVTENDANDPKITVTGLDIILFDGLPLEGQLELAKVSCGKNVAGDSTPRPTPEPPSDDDDGDDDGDDSDDSDDSDDGDGPKSVDSGLNDGGNLGTLGITGLLAASTLVGSAARQRLLLDR